MSWLLRLYPREWRRRYGAEVEEIVAAQPRSLQLVLDLLGGAVDARLKPQAFARRVEEVAANPEGESDMWARMNGCGTPWRMSRKEALIGAGLTLGSALVVAAIMLVGHDPVTETIGLTMSPGVLVIGTQFTYMRGHSLPAKVILLGGPFVVLFLIGLAAGLAQRG